jgi:hypothetical protein
MPSADAPKNIAVIETVRPMERLATRTGSRANSVMCEADWRGRGFALHQSPGASNYGAPHSTSRCTQTRKGERSRSGANLCPDLSAGYARAPFIDHIHQGYRAELQVAQRI